MTTITPEALERAQIAYSRALGGPGSHARGLEAAILAALPELLAAQPYLTLPFYGHDEQQQYRELHQHLLDMLGAKDHADAGRIIGELHAAARVAAQPASSAGGQQPVREVIADMALATPRPDGLVSQELVFAWREKLLATLSAAPVAGEAAQLAVDLRQVREAVQKVRDWASAKTVLLYTTEVTERMDAVLALIDSQHQQQESSNGG